MKNIEISNEKFEEFINTIVDDEVKKSYEKEYVDIEKRMYNSFYDLYYNEKTQKYEC